MDIIKDKLKENKEENDNKLMPDVVRAQLLDLNENIQNNPNNHTLYNKRAILKHL